MKKLVKIALLVIGAVATAAPLFGQDDAVPAKNVENSSSRTDISLTEYPEVGKHIQNYLIRNVEYNFDKKQVYLNEFKGKWVVLDFWNKYCLACVKSFPKLNTLTKKFKDKVAFVLVGREDKENQIRPMFSKFMQKYKFEFAAAFDSTLMDKLDIQTGPFIIVISPTGIVKAITYTLSDTNVEDFLAGLQPSLPKAYRGTQSYDTEFDFNKPLLIGGNGGQDTAFISRSLFANWDSSTVRFVPNDIASDFMVMEKSTNLQAVGVPLHKLYNLAFIGKADWHYGDSLNSKGLYGLYFRYPQYMNSSISKAEFNDFMSKMYSYSLIVKNRSMNIDERMKYLQKDLEYTFGYRASLRQKAMPYFKIILSKNVDPVSLKTKYSKMSIMKGKMRGFIGQNIPMSSILNRLSYRSGNEFRSFIDETGIDFNIDVNLDCDWTDFDEVRKAFRANGLEIIEAEKEMTVIVLEKL